MTIEMETRFPNHQVKELMHAHGLLRCGGRSISARYHVCQGGQGSLVLGFVQLDLVYSISFPTEWGCDSADMLSW